MAQASSSPTLPTLPTLRPSPTPRYPDYPFESHFIVIDGHRMHYLDEGPRESGAPAVVLLHGNPTWSYYYRKLIPALSEHRRVIAPDWIGCGLSDHPEHSHYRAVDRIEHLKTLLAHCGVDRCTLVMHDWGGPIGTGFAVREPARIERMIYLNTTLTETESLPIIIKNAARPFIGKVLTKYTRHFVDLTTTFGVANPIPKEVRAAYAAPYLTSRRRTAVWDFVADIPFDADHPSYVEMLGMADKLPLLKHVPVQIIWGLKDPCFHREMLSKVAAHFPQAAVLEIGNASHLVLEDASALVIATIQNFLKGIAGGERGITGSNSVIMAEAPSPALLTGGLYGAMHATAAVHGARPACVIPRFPLELTAPGATVEYRTMPFQELRALIVKYERGLREVGLEQGDRVVMLVPPGIEFLALSFAVMGRGAVPIFLDPGMGREKLLACMRTTKARGLIAAPRAILLRWIAADLYRSFAWKVFVTDLPLPGFTTNGFLKRFTEIPLAPVEVARDATALIAFTSGATGTPKGVLFTRAMLEAQLDIFGTAFGISDDLSVATTSSEDDRGGREQGVLDLPLLPIFSLFTLALGIGSVFPPMDPAKPLALDPQKIVRIVKDLAVQYSFGSPTLWNKIAEYCARSAQELPSLRRIFMAGAPVPLPTLQRVREIAPHADAFTPYGATEALPVTLVSGADILARESSGELALPALSGEVGTYVGRPISSVELRIVERSRGTIASLADTRALPARTIGEIVVRGANVSSAYLENADATARAKIADENRGRWHRMGDVGYIDAEGGLYFCGRAAHIVECRDRIFYSIPCERILNADARVRRSALVKLASHEDAALVVELHPHAVPRTDEGWRELRNELCARTEASPLTAPIRTILFHHSFPVDARHNAKIFRDQLGIWADQEISSGRQPYGSTGPTPKAQEAA